MTAKFHFINHACFMLEKNNSAIIFDPYLDDNPEGLTAKDIKVDYIFVSHGHFDHLGSAFEIDFYGTKLYFAGDTALFSDMQLLPKLDAFEYAVLPIGGNFTMDPNDALIACKLLQAKYVIPVHYNTWPPIAQDVEAFKAAVEDETDSKVLIVKPGNTIDID